MVLDPALQPLLDDEPTLHDSLERRELVQKLRDIIATCQPPQVLGLHGDWGAGKTSFLHQLQWELTGECPQQATERREGMYAVDVPGHVTVVWFEAWRYQHEKAPIVALLQEIRSQLPWTSKVREQTKKIGETAIRSALLAFEDITKKIGIQASKIQQEGEAWEERNLASVLPSHFVRQHLEAEIGRLIGSDQDSTERLVVIVDDLDRCDPAAAYRLLEGIKIYLNLPNCVFVLGMNQKVVEKAIADQLTDDKTDDPQWIRLKSREYLEKICQNIIHLPLMPDPAQMLCTLIESLDGSPSVIDIVRQHRCLPHNPRKVKAFANLLRRNASDLPPAPPVADENQKHWARMVVTLACLYQFHPEIYRHLEAYRQPWFDQLREWCVAASPNEKTDHELLKRLRQSWAIGDVDSSMPTPSSDPLSQATFPDPVEGGVLRVQKVIAKLDGVTATELRDFLVF